MTPLANALTFRRWLTAVLLAGAFLAAALPQVVHGYALEGPKWPNGSNPAVQLELGSAGRTLSDGNTSWNAAVSPAVDMWNQVIGSIQVRAVNSTASISQGDRLNSLSFGSSFFGHSFGSSTLAVTSYSYSGSTMTEGDIVFNTAWTWDSYRGSLRSAIDIQRVALHELGHLIGLAHSSVSNAIMYPSINDSYLLTADDISGIQSLYGAPTSSPTPTPTPSPTATASATPTATPSATPTATPSATVTPTPTATPGSSPAVMTSPVPGSTFTSSTVTFSWTAGGANSYALVVGSSFNGSDIYSSGITNAKSITVSRIPTDGRTIYVSLYSSINGSWVANQYTYVAFSTSAPPTPTPTPTPTATPSATPTATPSSSLAVTISASPTSIRSGDTSMFTISASAPAAGPITVQYAMSGSAVLGKNYTLSGVRNQATIPAGATSTTVVLTATSVGNTGKTATMTLTSGSGYAVSSPSSASVFMRR